MSKENNKQKSVLLIITGSIAAVKSMDLISKLKNNNIDVKCVLTKSAEKFVTPLSCASLTGNKVYTDLFSANSGAYDDINMDGAGGMDHINLSRQSDLIVIAPASANIIGKMGNGIADDMVSSLLLAANKEILIAPAMNKYMWQNPAVKRNVRQLKKDGINFVGPESGDLACGENGLGRMSDPDKIYVNIEKLLLRQNNNNENPLSGVKILVTSGPTVEAIDPVRFISNRSSGKQGNAIAASLAQNGADVTLVSGPTNMPDLENVNTIHVESAKEMYDACKKELPFDVAICTAAVADWGVMEMAEQKIKKDNIKKDNKDGDITFTFAENPDILSYLSCLSKNRPSLVIGFAAESEFIEENARVKLEKKGCDWIVANDIQGGKIFNSDENTVYLIKGDSKEIWPTLSKKMVAERLSAHIISELMEGNKQKLRLIKSV